MKRFQPCKHLFGPLLDIVLTVMHEKRRVPRERYFRVRERSVTRVLRGGGRGRRGRV